ncbi:MAG: hypothetical protein EOP04_02415 [Proteobacteria bacterium]|nr:MAG: hypothetical protein EOP04_02415 [Pseudomonadota bacterium]
MQRVIFQNVAPLGRRPVYHGLSQRSIPFHTLADYQQVALYQLTFGSIRLQKNVSRFVTQKCQHMVKVNYYLKGALNDAALTTLKTNDLVTFNEIVEQRRMILISIVCRKKRVTLSTNRKASLRIWDKKKQTIKLVGDVNPADRKTRLWLQETSQKLEAALSMKPMQLLTNKNALYTLIREQVITSSITTWTEAFDKFIEEHRTPAGDRIKPATVKKYHTVRNHIIDFQGHDKYELEAINEEWFDRFKSFLYGERNLTDNSMCKYVKALKTYLLAISAKMKIRLDVDLKSIRAVEKVPNVHVLRLDELKDLMQHKFIKPEHGFIRDVFVFQCLTGQRYSDIYRIQWDDIHNSSQLGKVWMVTTVKTEDNLMVPLSAEAQKILEQYAGYPNPLPRFANQYMNRELKVMAKELGLIRRVQVVKYRDGRREEKYHFLWEILSTHMARKTFISNSLEFGIPERAIREISGHKDEKSFKRYIQVDTYHQRLLLDAWNNL